MTTCPHAGITADAAGLPEFDPHAPDFLTIAYAVYAAWRESGRTERVRTTTERSVYTRPSSITNVTMASFPFGLGVISRDARTSMYPRSL